MYNMMIVDDEASVVNGLAYDIEWNDLGIEGIYKAENAQQVLELLKVTKIDIVISDIRMPEMDGLEMTAEIKRQWPYSKIILISGYDDFEYAQKAIELGVFGYVTKPVADDEIRGKVSQAIKEIDSELLHEKAFENAKKKFEESIPILQERYLTSWIIMGRTAPSEDVEKFKSYRFTISETYPSALIMVRIDRNSTNKGPELLNTALQYMLFEILCKDPPEVFLIDPDENLLAVVQDTDEEKLKDKLRYLAGMAENFLLSVKKSLNIVVSLFWGHVTISPNELHESYVELLSKAHMSLAFSDGLILGADDYIRVSGKNPVAGFNRFPSISLLVETGQKEKVINRLNEVFSQLEKTGISSIEILLDIYHLVSEALITDGLKHDISLEDWAGEQHNAFFDFTKNKSITELKQWCINSVSGYMDFVIKMGMQKSNKLVDQTKSLLLEKLDVDNPVTDIASRIYVNPSYLSRLFKKETGMSITDYLVELRINRAKELLERQNMKVYEIAEQVGYHSYAHFNRVFKQMVGVTPKSYQINH